MPRTPIGLVRLLPIALPAFAAALATGACEETTPPPGTIIGRFAFEATLEPAEFIGACRFGGVPRDMEFEAILSYEPESGGAEGQSFYLQIEGALHTGAIRGEHFVARAPPQSPGAAETYSPRRLRSCTCPLRFVEVIEGDLLQQLPAEGCGGVVPVATCDGGACGEPAAGPGDGGFDPELFGGVCGVVREQISPGDIECSCNVAGRTEAFTEPCEVRYRLVGDRV